MKKKQHLGKVAGEQRQQRYPWEFKKQRNNTFDGIGIQSDNNRKKIMISITALYQRIVNTEIKNAKNIRFW